MLMTFEEMNEGARIWIYQADRAISKPDQKQILVETSQFLNQWAAHGSDLKAASDILHDHFLIISTDETFTQASGCSIDSSVRFVQGLGQKYNIDFFQRTNLAFWRNDQVELFKMNELKEAVSRGEVTADTLFFENTVGQKGQLNTSWRVKAGETWLKRYFKASVNV